MNELKWKNNVKKDEINRINELNFNNTFFSFSFEIGFDLIPATQAGKKYYDCRFPL